MSTDSARFPVKEHTEAIEVTVTDIHMTFAAMVAFILKFTLAFVFTITFLLALGFVLLLATGLMDKIL